MIPNPKSAVLEALAAAVHRYQQDGNVPDLLQQVDAIAANASADTLLSAAQHYQEIPEVSGPLCELVLRGDPHHARALVLLANAYWLTGRGPEVVGDLASRALAADPDNRAAWHLWALTEPSPRQRTARWQQVAARFPSDHLARANLADNAASLAGAEHDPAALQLAIQTYQDLLDRATRQEERSALERALETLRTWRM
jgi:hypothetical protein